MEADISKRRTTKTKDSYGNVKLAANGEIIS